ncbi:MAG: hypothetical protein HYV09_34320 [Deltaproteobacteria bacterium]|nr:hypothetical protein [Deltaproteobacteria bacterium]
MRCVACGNEVALDDVTCRRCTAATRGSSFSEAVEVHVHRPLPLPRVCCCCLDPAYAMAEESEESEGLRTVRKLTYDLPWCSGCLALRRSLRRTAVWVAFVAAASAFAGTYVLPGSTALYVALPTFIVAWIVAQPLLVRYALVKKWTTTQTCKGIGP